MTPSREATGVAEQGNEQLEQTTEGWRPLQVLSPIPISSNRDSLVVTSPAEQPTALLPATQLPALSWVHLP